MTSMPDQPDQESARSTDEQPGARIPWGGSVRPLGPETILRVAVGYIRANPGLVLSATAVG